MQTRGHGQVAPSPSEGGEYEQPTPSQTAEAADLTEPAAPGTDPTLRTSQYALYGVPAPSRPWSSGDYVLAAQAIQKLY